MNTPATEAAAGAWRRWIVTVGGSGMSPVAPGTAGSLLTTILLAIVLAGLYRYPISQTEIAWNVALVLGTLLFGALCVALGRWTVQYYGRKDPGACVLDEAAGICLTALLVPIYPQGRGYWTLLAVFAGFRLFDIVKLPPARQLERLPCGWGILMDDLAAAVYANVVCQVLFRWLFT
ncbi:MAG TPA: phosphatidylglycerophosphatase A [Tepidisphaeraceae bacterium]